MRKRISVALVVGSLVLAGCTTSVQGTPTASGTQDGEISIDDYFYASTPAEMCRWLVSYVEAFAPLVEDFDRKAEIRDFYDWMIESEDWSALSKDERERTVRAFDLAESGRC